MVTVSVVIPTYNRADVLPRAIDSVLAQTYEDLEVIIVDDGSTDHTDRVVSSYDDDRIRYIPFERNKGANAARTTGIKSAEGEYVAFLDSDDEWLSKKIEAQVETAHATNAEVVYTGIRQVDADGRLNSVSAPNKAGDVTDDLLFGNFIGSFSVVMVSQTLIEMAGLPDSALPCWQDWEWYLRLSDHGKFASVDRPLVIRHNDNKQISDDTHRRFRSFNTLKRKIQHRASTKQQNKMAIANLHFRIGYSAISNHEYSIARTHFMKSIRLHPKKLKSYVYLLTSSPLYSISKKIKRSFVRMMSS